VRSTRRVVSRRAGAVGRIAASLLGVGWNIATYLVVPILVVENVGPVEAIQRSTRLLKQTWGEQIIGNLGLGAVFGLLTFGVMLVGIPLVLLAAGTGSTIVVVTPRAA
jgi:Family of unknown function (DUF6159)